MVIANPSAAVNGIPFAGAVYVYRIVSGSKFERVAKLVSREPIEDECMGSMVKVFGDTIVACSQNAVGYYPARVHVFELKE